MRFNIVSDILTSQMITENYINLSGVTNNVWMSKPLSTDESNQLEHSKLGNT